MSSEDQARSAGSRRRSRSARAGSRLEGERRVVTILFCDVKGSTAMAEQLDPEDWAAVMDEAFDYLIEPIDRFDGTVARLMGDAVLAFFGAPVAHEDDAERAVLAALAILESMDPFGQRIQREFGLDFKVRVGINTGTVVVGEIGSAQAMEYTAMGDAVNLAARMEQLAEPGTVQVAESTYRRVAPLFEVEPLGSIEVKGKQDVVRTYRVLRPKERPGRRRGIEGLSSPVVGRAAQMEGLQQATSELHQRRGGIVFLLGEAGLGKSRLIEELERDWRSNSPEPSSWVLSRGVSYDHNRPYSLFLGQVRSLLGIQTSDDPATVRDKIAAGTQAWSPDQRELAGRAIEVLFAVHGEAEISPQEAEALKRELTGLIVRSWKEAAQASPTMLVFDDLHWADQPSIEVLQSLFLLTETEPLLILCAMRPHRQSAGWRAKETAERDYPHRYRQIELEPLTEDQSDELITNLLAIADLPSNLRRRILGKVEGNPFFVEEVIRTLIDSGAVVRDPDGLHWRATADPEDIALPDNLQALLVARIDRLQKEVRRTLQLAAVIGRAFYYRVLERISQEVEALPGHLNTLQRVELIREAARQPELEYLFVHELSRDAAYHSILRRERREFHQKVGESIELLYADRLEDEAHRLAHHFAEAGDDTRTLKYARMAGDAAARIYANAAAIGHYRKAVEIAGRVDLEPDDVKDLFLRLGRTLEVEGQFSEAIEVYQRLEAIGQQRSAPELELAAVLGQAILHAIPTALVDIERGSELAAKARQMAEELGDPRGESRAYWVMLLLSVYGSLDYDRAVEYGERSLSLARRHGTQEELAFTLNDLSRAYLSTGRFEAAEAVLEECQQIWRELNNLPLLADSIITSSIIKLLSGHLHRAQEHTLEALEISRSIGNLWGGAFSLSMLGPTYILQAAFEQAIDVLQEAALVSERAQFLGGVVSTPAYLSMTYGLLGELRTAHEWADRAMASIPQDYAEWVFPHGMRAVLLAVEGKVEQAAEAFQVVEEHFAQLTHDPLVIGPSLYILAEYRLAAGQDEQLLSILAESHPKLLASGAQMFEPDLLYYRARALRALGQTDEARQVLHAALELAQALDARLVRFRIAVEWADLERVAGDLEAAEGIAASARADLAWILDHLSRPELRDSFLKQPQYEALRPATKG